jgi:hypothetical protein
VPQPAGGRSGPYDPDVRRCIEELGQTDEVPSGVCSVSQAISDVLYKTVSSQTPQLKPVVNYALAYFRFYKLDKDARRMKKPRKLTMRFRWQGSPKTTA